MPNCLECCYCEAKIGTNINVPFKETKHSCLLQLCSMKTYNDQIYLELMPDCLFFRRLPQPTTSETQYWFEYDNLPTCPMCNTPQWKEGVCPTCIIRLKEAEETLAKFKQIQTKSKPKIVLGQRKVQVQKENTKDL